MKIRNITLILCLLPVVAWGAANNARVGMSRSAPATARMPAMAPGTAKKKPSSTPVVEQRVTKSDDASDVDDSDDVDDTDDTDTTTTTTAKESGSSKTTKETSSENCRDAYRACMDEFCLLDETEGSRCACSDNIEKSKKLIQEIQKIQSEADDLYTTGVEREKLGAKAKLVFGGSDAAKKSSLKSGIDFASWLNSGADDGELGEDADIGQNLYAMAAESCAEELKQCGSKAKSEETLYGRMVVNDCKAFSTYLADQKRDAEMNKKTAEAAVRKARLEMLDTTNKYNRGECLLVYRSCIADKGGCGVNFENCLDEGLLARRSHACEDVLDQCMAVRKDVIKDWEEESVSVLKEAAKYADKNERATCLAKIQNCLEEGCSTSTESACLSDVKVAAGICPIITECNEKIPGLQSVVNDKLGYLQVKFCENDIDACLKDKCGTDFTKPECVGKGARDIADTMCPQSMFPSCKTMQKDNFEVIISSAMLHMDYQLLTGCINQFSEKLTTVCGTDMACIPVSDLLMAKENSKLKKSDYVDMSKWVDLNGAAGKKLQSSIRTSVRGLVDNFFEEFEQDLTLSACKDVYEGSSTKVSGREGVKTSVFNTAKQIAYEAAVNRADRELTSLMDELKIKEETDRNRKYCMKKYKEEQKPDVSDDDDTKTKNYSYIRSVTYEPALHNCHVCRMQQVCETGGESKWTSALKSAAGGLSAGASAGTMVSPGWGTAIGGLVGAAGAGIMGAMSGGEKDFCQELESCEDINVGDITEEDLRDL